MLLDCRLPSRAKSRQQAGDHQDIAFAASTCHLEEIPSNGGTVVSVIRQEDFSCEVDAA